MSALELKIPPVAQTLIIGTAMWLVAKYASAFAFDLPWRPAIAAAFGVAGALAGVAGVAEFRRAGTTVDPTRPRAVCAMVTSGVFRFSRNPMYLGLVLLLTAWAVYLSHALAFAFLPLFVVYMTRFQILPEERVLSGKFGSQFTDYKRSVRRWL